jgi:glutamate dehydrogenase
VTAALSQSGHDIQIVIHPIYVVKRDSAGALVEVLDQGAAAGIPAGYVAESWMSISITRETDAQVLAGIQQSIAQVLADVKHAVSDWAAMVKRANDIAQQLHHGASGFSENEITEAISFLEWITDEHFTFTGYAEYDFTKSGLNVELVKGTGLGILSSSSQEDRVALSVREQAKSSSGPLLVVTKGNSRSTVHRPTYLDYISIAKTDAKGNVVGEYRFLGLFTSSAYTQSVFTIPLVARKADTVMQAFALNAESHSGKDLIQFLETYPRDHMFQVSAQVLEATARGVLQIQERRQVKVFAHNESFGRFATVLVYFPRDRYNTEVRQRMEAILLDVYGAESVDFNARLTESILARLQFDVRMPANITIGEVDMDALEQRLTAATRFWEDDFIDAVVDQVGEEEGARINRKWSAAFPESFKEDIPASQAVTHIKCLEELEFATPGQISVALYPATDAEDGTRRFTIYRLQESITLSSVLPMLHDMGIEVIDERAYDLRLGAGKTAWIYDFGISFDESAVPALDSLAARFCESFMASWSAEVESDGFNALIVHAGLTARNVAVIRSYAAYLRQAGTPFSQGYIQQVLRSNSGLVALILELFATRFDVRFAGDREAAEKDVLARITKALDAVKSLDHDRIMRGLVALVRATLRTNAYQRDAHGAFKSVMAFKIASGKVPELPLPVPMFEIWVCAPRVEGIHLRFDTVARGGLRWSDRFEDFRTEILGLVKAQMVKNTVIVPSGAKGGFVVKRSPDPSDRDAWLAEGVACYQMFIGALLDVTDNLNNGVVVPPIDVVRHDPDDPYLVVAADKGTATFSDIANKISLDRGFWMGDAFASGGSIGYDHKAMGITARGAWESVKRHFLELGVDSQSQDFTAVGVGDMSGDVFGNGMLLSEHIRLVAAFDHRHIFLDPNPDAAKSFKERQRMFNLPRSSWEDYDASLISKGGGVISRAEKSISITPEVRAALSIESDDETMTPNQLMTHILKANVDLLWNGGIGTYIKSAAESNPQVGDKANDGIRINGADLRVKVVGEGGNLGATQLGRIEAASNGVKINTDAIDNSAGVDTSDHEVNIKILLNQAITSGVLKQDERNDLLASMTDEVGLQVLRDNYEQNVVLEQSRFHAPVMLRVHQRVMHGLESTGLLNRAVEYLPTDAQIDALHNAGKGLTSPELSVLMAYVKIEMKQVKNDNPMYDEPWCSQVLTSYFPTALRSKYAELMENHPLRRQIISTVLTNDLVNHGGITFAWRAAEETGAGQSEIVRAYKVTREIFDYAEIWNAIEALDGKVSTDCQTELYLEARRLLDRSVRWFLQARGGRLDVAAEIAKFQKRAAAIRGSVPGMLRGAELARYNKHVERLVAMGAPDVLARRVAGLLDEFSLLDIIEFADRANQDADQVSRLYFSLSERFEVDRLLHHITALPRDDRWSSNARSALRSDLYAALAGLTWRVIQAMPVELDQEARIAQWEERFAEGVARTRATLNEIAISEQSDLATLSVALRAIRTLVGQGAS